MKKSSTHPKKIMRKPFKDSGFINNLEFNIRNIEPERKHKCDMKWFNPLFSRR